MNRWWLLNRWLLLGIGALIVALVLLGVAIVRRPTSEAVPVATPRPAPPASPVTPTLEPSPWIEDNDLPPQPPAQIRVCCCSTPYGACVDQLMVKEAARLHAFRHQHDLIGRPCADASEEERALRSVLFRPEQVEMNPRNRLAMADREAYRQRVQ